MTKRIVCFFDQGGFSAVDMITLKAVDRKYTKNGATTMKLRMCHRFLANELNAILAAMRAGEVNAVD